MARIGRAYSAAIKYHHRAFLGILVACLISMKAAVFTTFGFYTAKKRESYGEGGTYSRENGSQHVGKQQTRKYSLPLNDDTEDR